MFKVPEQIDLIDQKQYRIIPSVYPPINFFEDLVDAAEMHALYEIESLTNERLRQDVGDIFLVAPEDCVAGSGASVVMAAFTHVSTSSPSRFTDGTYGVYYASMSKETAIYETIYHRERFLAATDQSACEITMRVYEGQIKKPLHDICEQSHQYLHHPTDYTQSQAFAKQLKEKQAWGIVYDSVRQAGGRCIAALRPPAVSNPKQISHLRYVWNGTRITQVFDTNTLITLT